MNKVKFSKYDWLCAAIACIASLALYVWTAAPNVTLLDSGEFTVAAEHFGVPHPTGYPLWTILSGLFLHIPWGNAAHKIALFSGVCASLAVGLCALISSHGIRWLFPQINRSTSCICTLTFSLLLAFSTSMWSQATIAEVYTLHALVIGLFFLGMYRFVHDPESDANLLWCFFFLALAFSNHHLTLTMTPLPFLAVLLLRRAIIWDLILFSLLTATLFLLGFAVLSGELLLMKTMIRLTWCCLLALIILLWVKRGQVEWKLLAFLPIVIAVGLLPYLYMPMASSTNPPMNWGYTRDMDGFFYSINRSQYSGSLSTLFQKTFGKLMGSQEIQQNTPVEEEPLKLPLRIRAGQWVGFFWVQLSNNFTPLCIFVFFCAFFSILRLDLARRCWIYILNIAFVLAAFLQPLLENINTSAASWWEQMPFHTYTNWIFALLCAAGFAFLWQQITRRLPRLQMAIWLALLLPLLPLFSNYSVCSQRNRWFGWDYGHDMLKDLPKNSVIYGGTDPGRFVPTYMIFGESGQAAKWKRDPDFDRRDLYIITQNALADVFYQKYINDHYGENRPAPRNAFDRWLGREKQYPATPLKLPTHAECQAAIKAMGNEVVKNNPLNPLDLGSLYHSAIAKWIFEHNKKDHEFFVEESFPMEWSYPYATPHGLVYRINPEPLKSLPKEIVDKDFAFWRDYIKKLTSNPDYFKDYDAQRSFSKLRVTMGRIYQFRKMNKEAEEALTQAIGLWPESLEAISLLSNLLWERGEYEQPINLLTRALIKDPNNISVLQMADIAIKREKLQAGITTSEAALKRNPKDREAFKKLMDDYV
ncbi:MAG: DUF2723 domain-containing protein, partial [Chthoniobacterales bacterium]